MKRPCTYSAMLLLAACAPIGGPERGPGGKPLRQIANPSAVIAAESAFSRLARERGQWTAFRETAAPGAVMFVPQRSLAETWLKGRPDPAAAVQWNARSVWMSCDGGHAVTHGAWARPGTNGEFATVWERQPKGGYKWLVDMNLPTERDAPAPEMIAAKVADCSPGAGPLPASPPPAGHDVKDARSADMTLQWSTAVGPDGSRSLQAYIWNGSSFVPVLNFRYPAVAAS